MGYKKASLAKIARTAPTTEPQQFQATPGAIPDAPGVMQVYAKIVGGKIEYFVKDGENNEIQITSNGVLNVPGGSNVLDIRNSSDTSCVAGILEFDDNFYLCCISAARAKIGLQSVPVALLDDSSPIASQLAAINFAGAGVTVTDEGDGLLCVNIPGSAGSSKTFPNFAGAEVSVVSAPVLAIGAVNKILNNAFGSAVLPAPVADGDEVPFITFSCTTQNQCAWNLVCAGHGIVTPEGEVTNCYFMPARVLSGLLKWDATRSLWRMMLGTGKREAGLPFGIEIAPGGQLVRGVTNKLNTLPSCTAVAYTLPDAQVNDEVSWIVDCIGGSPLTGFTLQCASGILNPDSPKSGGVSSYRIPADAIAGTLKFDGFRWYLLSVTKPHKTLPDNKGLASITSGTLTPGQLNVLCTQGAVGNFALPASPNDGEEVPWVQVMSCTTGPASQGFLVNPSGTPVQDGSTRYTTASCVLIEGDQTAGVFKYIKHLNSWVSWAHKSNRTSGFGGSLFRPSVGREVRYCQHSTAEDTESLVDANGNSQFKTETGKHYAFRAMLSASDANPSEFGTQGQAVQEYVFLVKNVAGVASLVGAIQKLHGYGSGITEGNISLALDFSTDQFIPGVNWADDLTLHLVCLLEWTEVQL